MKRRCEQMLTSSQSDDSRKHRTFTFPDTVDFKVRTPQMNYKNKVCSIEDVFEAMKKGKSSCYISSEVQELIGVDTKNGIWEQSGDIFTQIIKRTSVFRSKKGLKSLALHSEPIARPSSLLGNSPSSRLKFSVEAPTPGGGMDDDSKTLDANLSRAMTSRSHDKDSGTGVTGQTLGSPIARVVSRLSQSGGGHLGSTHSNGSGSGSSDRHGHGLSKSPSSPLLNRRDSDAPDSWAADDGGSDHEHESVGVGRAVKGFIGKFKRNHDSPDSHGSTSRKASHDDVSHFSSVGRSG